MATNKKSKRVFTPRKIATSKVIICILIAFIAIQFYFTSFNENWDSPEEPSKIPMAQKPTCEWIPLNHAKEVKINDKLLGYEEMEKSLPEIEMGGAYSPQTCKPKSLTAVVVPFRNRSSHLAIFLNNIHKFLIKQQMIAYQIFVIEQADKNPFNRGKLFNAGFVEALKIKPFDCFIFHDVDFLPMDERNLYQCSDQPRHFAIAIDRDKYKLAYPNFFGGISGFTREHYQLTNGFSNLFWGWGGEDDDSWNRVHFHGLQVLRYPIEIGKYRSLSHAKEKPNPLRYKVKDEGKKLYRKDGLNNVKYELKEIAFRKLYTWILVDLLASNKSEKTS